MGKSFSVTVTGAREVRRALREIEDAAAKKGMQAELKSAYMAAARVVEIAAKQEAPRQSGKLAGTIKAKATTRGAAVTVGGTKATPYAAPIHWGWPSRPNKGRGWRGGPIRANRFLTRAAKDNADAVADALERGLREFVERVMPNG